MVPRFLQLFLLASVVLLLPTLFYLSREKTPYVPSEDYALLQTSQGHGPEPVPVDANMAQSWKWGKDSLGSWREGAERLLEAAKVKDLGSWHADGTNVKDEIEKQQKDDKASKAKDAKEAVAGDATAKSAEGGGSGSDKTVIMGKMVNETAKAELGRATWRFLHTMTLRFPEHPTKEERETLMQFFQTFSLLYPCGDCANHFQRLLKELPPQTSSRMASALWLCSAHNRVNERLGKPEFPCDKLDETYDCGCGDEAKKDDKQGLGDSKVRKEAGEKVLPRSSAQGTSCCDG